MAYFFGELDAIIKVLEDADGPEIGEWIRQSLDPLHHKMLGRTPVGPPSRTSKPVIVYADTNTYPISRPTGFDPTLNFSACIEIFEDQWASLYFPCLRDQNNIIPAPGGAPVNHGGVVLTYNQTGTNFNWSTPFSAANIIGWQDALALAVGSSEELAMSVMAKFVNTTSPLNIGGSVHTARHNDHNNDSTTSYIFTSGSGDSAIEVFEEFQFPFSEAQLAGLPGYIEDKAALGFVVLAPMDPFAQMAVPNFTGTVYESGWPDNEPNTLPVMAPQMRASTIVGSAASVPVYRSTMSGIKPQQIRLLNLPPQTTGFVRIDRISAKTVAPSVSTQIGDVSILRKGTPYCSKAMNLVACLLRFMPSWQPESANRSFSWLKNAVSQAGPDIADILGFIPHPLAQAGQMALNFLTPRQTPAYQSIPGARSKALQAQFSTVSNRPPAAPLPPRLNPRGGMLTAPGFTRRTRRTTVPGGGVFSGVTYTNTPAQRVLTTNPGNKTLRNRAKRQRRAARRTGNFPQGGYTITNV